MIRLGWDARTLGAHLGLGDLNRRPVCHGYQNACICSECKEREQNPPKPAEPAKQPWELAA